MTFLPWRLVQDLFLLKTSEPDRREGGREGGVGVCTRAQCAVASTDKAHVQAVQSLGYFRGFRASFRVVAGVGLQGGPPQGFWVATPLGSTGVNPAPFWMEQLYFRGGGGGVGRINSVDPSRQCWSNMHVFETPGGGIDTQSQH
jgi:hypothetical protein